MSRPESDKTAIDVPRLLVEVAKLRASERRLRAMIERGWDVVALMRADGELLYTSPSSVRVFGYTHEELAAHGSFDLVHPEDVSRVAATFAAFLAVPGGTRAFQYRYLHKSGAWRWVEGVATNLVDDPDVGAIVLNYRDITEAKVAEEQLRELLAREQSSRIEAERANRTKDEFLAMLGHELRNPLSAVRNSVFAARLDESNRERALEIAGHQADQLTRLIDDLLDVARISHGRIALRRSRVRLSAVVDRALETTRPLVEDRGHVVAVRKPRRDLELDADAARIEQVIVNLLENAAKYSGPGRPIELAVEDGGDHASVCVRDSGVGIAPDMLPSVFELFTQGERTLERSEGGLGIGLTLVKRIVELHGGAVEAHSAGLGLGAEFVFRLPVLAAASDASGVATPEAKAVPLRLVVVEDNPDAAESLLMLLRLAGHEVRVTADGVAGIETAAANPPDVMLVDIGLPGIDGYEVARRVRGHPRLRGIGLVALTGYGREEDKRRAAGAGFDHYLVKPVDPSLLGQVLGRWAPKE